MKHMQIIAQEPYEAPAILDITPITMGVVAGESGTDNGESDDNSGGIDD